jgi:DNA-binding SARP family transcriptional activator
VKSDDSSNAFLIRTLAVLLPDVFLHPVWKQFIQSRAHHSPESVRNLLDQLQKEHLENNPADQCQQIFLCAYLQARLKEHAAALNSILQAWELAEVHGLHQLACCAAWGACAISVLSGNNQEAVNWLYRLQQKLTDRHNWVLITLVELFRQSLSGHAPTPGELKVWLLGWGEWSFDDTELPPQMVQKAQPVSLFRGGSVRSYVTQLLNYIRYRPQSSQLEQRIGSNAVQGTDRTTEFKTARFPEEVISLEHSVLPVSLGMQSEDSPRPSFQDQSAPSPSSVPLAPKAGALPSLAVYCLGQFQIYRDEQLVENCPSRKALSVLKYLIVEHPTPVIKEILMDTFWPDSDIESGRRNLHQAIYSLRQVFRGAQHEFNHIWFKNDCYSLNPNIETWIDFREFEKCVDAGRHFDQIGQFNEAIEQYEIAEGLYQGDFLEEDLYEDWSARQREQLLNLYLSLVDRLSELFLKNRQYASAIHLCHKVLDKDRCYEAAHRILMQCFVSLGQRHLAVRQYRTCAQALREELDIQPSPETTRLYDQIVTRHGN